MDAHPRFPDGILSYFSPPASSRPPRLPGIRVDPYDGLHSVEVAIGRTRGALAPKKAVFRLTAARLRICRMSILAMLNRSWHERRDHEQVHADSRRCRPRQAQREPRE